MVYLEGAEYDNLWGVEITGWKLKVLGSLYLCKVEAMSEGTRSSMNFFFDK